MKDVLVEPSADYDADLADEVAASPAADTDRYRRWMTPAVVLSVILVRYLFGLERRVYSVYADEPATLAMARYLSGGTRWNLFNYGTWKPGLAVLLAPVYAVTDNAATVYRVGLAMNSIIAGVSVVVLVAIVRRLTASTHVEALLVSAGIALAPISLFASSAVWAEPLVTLVFLLTLLALLNLYDSGQVRHAAAATTMSVLGYFCHNRLLVVIPVVTVLAGVALVRRRRHAAAIAVTTWTVVLFAAAELASRAIISAVWEDPTRTNTATGVLEQLRSPAAIIDAAIGQAWYLATATLGLAVIGVVVATIAVLQRDRAPGRRIGMGLVLALTLPQFALSAVFMAERDRGDHLVYGRYNDAIVWPVVAIGIAWWLAQARGNHGRSRRMIVAALGAAGVIVSTGLVTHALHDTDFDERVTAMQMVPGIVWISAEPGAIQVLTTTLFCVALIALAVAMTQAGRTALRLAPIVVVVLLGVAAIRTHSDLTEGANTLTVARSVQAIEQKIPPGEVVGFGFSLESDEISIDTQRAYGQAFQFYLSRTRLVTDRGPSDDVGPYVFAPMDDPIMFDAQAEVLWLDPRIGIALWREPAAAVPG